MTAITHSVEIERSAEDTFAYLDALERHGEWQEAIVSTTVEISSTTPKIPTTTRPQ